MKQIKNRIQSIEMKFLRTEGCTKLDHIRNEDLRLELNTRIYSLNEKLINIVGTGLPMFKEWTTRNFRNEYTISIQ